MSKSKLRQEEYLKGLLKSLKDETDELMEMRDKIDERLEEVERRKLTLTRTFE